MSKNNSFYKVVCITIIAVDIAFIVELIILIFGFVSLLNTEKNIDNNITLIVSLFFLFVIILTTLCFYFLKTYLDFSENSSNDSTSDINEDNNQIKINELNERIKILEGKINKQDETEQSIKAKEYDVLLKQPTYLKLIQLKEIMKSAQTSEDEKIKFNPYLKNLSDELVRTSNNKEKDVSDKVS